VQVSRVDLDGRKIDFRLVREGEELLTRALKDKAGSALEPGADDRNGSRRSGRRSDKREENREGKREDRGAGAQRDIAASRAARSPIDSLKAAVKKSAANPARKSGKPGKKTRR
jgi:ribonuclease R